MLLLASLDCALACSEGLTREISPPFCCELLQDLLHILRGQDGWVCCSSQLAKLVRTISAFQPRIVPVNYLPADRLRGGYVRHERNIPV